MHVLAVDPGRTSGYAIATWHPQEHQAVLLQAGQSNFEALLSLVDANLGDYRYWPWTVVAERFVITPRTIKLTQQTDAIEVIGALRWLCHKYGVPPLALQAPADAKRLVTDTRLRALGWWQPGQDHARDALRHLALWLTKASWGGLPT